MSAVPKHWSSTNKIPYFHNTTCFFLIFFYNNSVSSVLSDGIKRLGCHQPHIPLRTIKDCSRSKGSRLPLLTWALQRTSSAMGTTFKPKPKDSELTFHQRGYNIMSDYKRVLRLFCVWEKKKCGVTHTCRQL